VRAHLPRETISAVTAPSQDPFFSQSPISIFDLFLSGLPFSAVAAGLGFRYFAFCFEYARCGVVSARFGRRNTPRLSHIALLFAAPAFVLLGEFLVSDGWVPGFILVLGCSSQPGSFICGGGVIHQRRPTMVTTARLGLCVALLATCFAASHAASEECLAKPECMLTSAHCEKVCWGGVVDLVQFEGADTHRCDRCIPAARTFADTMLHIQPRSVLCGRP